MVSKKLEDGTFWPAGWDDLSDLAWRLRYGAHPDFAAASVVEAYAHLLGMTQRDRNRKVKMIRRAGEA